MDKEMVKCLEKANYLEKALKETRGNFRRIMDSFPAGLILLEGKGLIEATSKSLQSLSGYGPLELRGKAPTIILRFDRKEPFDQFIKDNCIATLFETDLRRSDGSLIPIQFTASTINTYGATEGDLMAIAVIDQTSKRLILRSN